MSVRAILHAAALNDRRTCEKDELTKEDYSCPKSTSDIRDIERHFIFFFSLISIIKECRFTTMSEMNAVADETVIYD